MPNSQRYSIYASILGLILFLSGVGATLFIESVRYTELVSPSLNSVEPRDVYATIASQDSGKYIFLDVRSEEEYKKLHAKLSKNQPIATLFDLWRDLPRDKDTKIYLICSGGRLAGVAYGFLQLHGFTNIVHVTGGIQNWVSQDLPTESPSLFDGE